MLVHLRRCSSFISRAAAAGDASVLVGKFKSTPGQVFDACLDRNGFEVLRIDSDSVECRLTVTPALCNNFGTLHGGAIATLVDVVGTLALLGVDPLRPGVSVEMNQSFCAAATQGQKLNLVGRVLRTGKTLGFTETEIRIADGKHAGRLVATGRHTKYLALERAAK